MCESSVWARYPDGRTEKIADDVLCAKQEGEEVVLRWFLKEPLRVVGTIQEVDAVKHIITLNVTEAHDELVEAPGPAASHADPGTAHVHPHPHSH
jgi:predicted RNA-binding protein